MDKGTNFSIIEAAGGVVVSKGRGANTECDVKNEPGVKDGRVLMMLRRGMWDLPKGHLEPGESLRECAAREVCEECDLDPAQLTVHECIAETIHMSKSDEEKRTTWFRMEYRGDPERVAPQTEEDITALEWVTPDEARRRAAGSYTTIQEVIEQLIQTI